MNLVLNPEVHRALIAVFFIADMFLALYILANRGKKQALIAAGLLLLSFMTSCFLFWN